MELSSNLPEQQQTLDPRKHGRTLQVDFSWKRFKALITEKGDSDSRPLYIVDFKAFKPHLVFKSGADGSTIGTGTLHTVSINADCELRGKPIKLEAMKRFKTEYSHLSQAYSDTDEPVPLRWTSGCGFKTWDFICVDSQESPVAKFSANIWATKKIGNIEFLGPKANSEALREEIMVTGLTLFYCMVLRMNNIFSLFGAIFSKPGHHEKEA
ncbi:hypothetical protein D0Z07_7488 [Hyphodiscus hymeniophilus]|uniref:Uncharacterized protein n=1 Tax=Hyphodiscus hymeniophilus TaxID=353542 RepID=A0A9P6VEX2_9HELO|nr:hypothetical protein D0Z07_7488 [Hyphodiscus hymeniophilus]